MEKVDYDEKISCVLAEITMPEGLTLVEPHPDDFAYSHQFTSMSPETRAKQMRLEYLTLVRNLIEDGGEFISQGALERYRDAWSAYLAAHSRTASTFVTGRSKFPAKRNRKRGNTTDRRLKDIFELEGRIRSHIKRAQKDDAIEKAGGPEGVIRSEIEKLAELERLMTDANKIIRKKPKNTSAPWKEQALADLGLRAEQIEKLFEHVPGHGVGFPSYEITSVRGRLKRRRKKLEEMECAAARGEVDDEELEFKGVEGHGDVLVVLSVQDDRIRIHHDRKPPKAVRAALKSRGWRWSRKNTAWQRQLTANACCDAQYQLGLRDRAIENAYEEIQA